jgi:hypothetical protein
MRFAAPLLRRAAATLAGVSLTLLQIPVASAEGQTLFLRPHCELEDQAACPVFDTRDPTSLVTPALQPGDTLDIDVVIRNDGLQPIRRVRAWLSYDPASLNGLTIAAGTQFRTPLPGEVSFTPADGIAKIGFTASASELPAEALIVVARVRFTVREDGLSQSPISFYDQKPDASGHTYALAEGESTQSILASPLASLVVTVAAPTASSSSVPAEPAPSETAASSAPAASATSSAAQASSAAPPPPASFDQLQVQNVRSTTRGKSLYVGWDALRSSQLKGYNLYYGTQPGRYIQRRSLAAQVTSAEIPNLTPGTTYYAAVRAVNQNNEESAFSREAAVQIGNPETATFPLVTIPRGGGSDDTAPANPVNGSVGGVPGEAGLPTGLAPLLLLAAVIGAAFAFRRQAIALPRTHARRH